MGAYEFVSTYIDIGNDSSGALRHWKCLPQNEALWIWVEGVYPRAPALNIVTRTCHSDDSVDFTGFSHRFFEVSVSEYMQLFILLHYKQCNK